MSQNRVNTRELVLDILDSVTRQEEFSHIAEKNVLDKYSYLSKQERAFITRLAEGTLERMLELDYVLNQFSRTPVRKMKPLIRNILRMGVYQLLYMDSVPDSAACNEAVKLAVRHGFKGLRGFVNGVMRNIARKKDQISYPDPVSQTEDFLSVRYSMPQWLVKRMIRSCGARNAEKIFQAFLEERGTVIRVNTTAVTPEELEKRLTAQHIQVKRTRNLPYALEIFGYDRLDAIPEFREGLFYVQDTASMMVAETAAPKKGAGIIDVCAAPGGKSVQLAQMIGPDGHVDARDLTDYKAGLLEENKRRFHLSNMSVRVWDARRPDPDSMQKADIVIADLPCSGLGVIGRKTDLKYRVSEEQIQSLSELQRQILQTVSGYVKPGGKLIYSTCTITEEENQDNTRWFLEQFPEFTLVSERQYYPYEGCDGFYIAGMTRHE